ncbi:hypothetical protein D3C80_427110 [compost metagenome]
MNAGIASVKSLKLILAIEETINNPTIINAGAVAAEGTNKNNGAKNSAIKNIPAVLKAVNPVRPPAATPEALST